MENHSSISFYRRKNLNIRGGYCEDLRKLKVSHEGFTTIQKDLHCTVNGCHRKD